MNDLISRQAAITQLSHNKNKGDDEWELAVENDIQTIWKLPSARPEQKKGKWEYHSNPNIRGGMNPEDAYCSVCGFHICTPEVDDFDDYNFCPNCGAMMKGENSENN